MPTTAMDISPAVVAVCERFDAANDLVLEHVNAFLDLSPKWNLMRAALAGHLHLVQRLSRRNPKKFQRCSQEAMDSAAEFGHLAVSALVNAINAGHECVAKWLVANRMSDCVGKMGLVEYLSRRGHWNVAALTDKHPYLQELLDDDMMFTDDEEEDNARGMQEREFLRLWNAGMLLQ
ncbi:hypothetical protein Pcac1_g10960 [Phytophthora cactorum]|nr:hypothetical protein Pcac1_g10960 [Phytophthora cactorum]KAG3036403.1 hypothetical protein PC120_g258 [Phytophthora cactorum]